ncbi:hypothetical protein GO684_01810 [Wolbachia endosymbiont of Litomosoides brasiliensis]|uniref:hypothetical protein n=1 Tax=Wolbachia endosymbiont of Litomosoides brasiliensis TaxID=1812117 RepID=UPI00158E227D|nr:hypothetical protein [Wolbachia endosymbiont of Litomosoides brasiliensis]
MKEVKIRIQEKFGLNISKSTVYHDVQKMKFLYIALNQIHNEQDKGRQEEFFKKVNETIVSILNKSYSSLMNHGLAHIRKLDACCLERALY